MTGVAVPLKLESGSNVTVPFGLTVYVPSPGIVTMVLSHRLGDCASLTPDVVGSSTSHNFRLAASRGAETVPGVSLLNGVMVWLVSCAPDEVSFVATGGGMTVGVYVDDATWPSESDTW